MGKAAVPAAEVTASLYAKLRARYAAPKYALIEGVADGTGYAQKRWCDALAFGLWPSVGLSVEGFEIKATRADWQREMQDPDKARAFTPYCDRWYILAARGIVKVEELPATWGLMEPAGRGLKIRKVAETIDRSPPDAPFLAAIARYAVRSNAIDDALRAAKGEWEKERRRRDAANLPLDRERSVRDLKRLQEDVAAFEAKSGIKIDLYNGGRLGDAVKVVIDARVPSVLRQLRAVERSAKDLQKYAKDSARALEAAEPEEVGGE